MNRTKLPLPITFATAAALLAAGAWYGLERPAGTPSIVAAVKATLSGASAPVDSPRSNGADTALDPVASAVGFDPLFSAPSRVIGQRLDPKGAAYMQALMNGEDPRGRSGDVDPTSFEKLATLDEGAPVSIPLFGGEVVKGYVGMVDTEDEGFRRMAGPLTGERKGSFYFSYDGKEASGMVRFPEEKITYIVARQANGKLQMVELPISEVECTGIPKVAASKSRIARGARTTPQPVLDSRPGAAACLFIDFDGAVIKDPLWYSLRDPVGPAQPMVAEPSGFTDAQIENCWRRVVEDYLPFNINVTTDEAVYKATPVGSRMRCIVTSEINGEPASSYFTGGFAIGGIALLRSFANAGGTLGTPPNTVSLKKNVPCWVFEDGTGNDPKFAADAIAHEFGHTFALRHDGLTAPVQDYFEGQGDGPTSWGPIMGAPYDVNVTQWSKGEYPKANRKEDDIAIIANATNGFGYAADLVGDTFSSSTALGRVGTLVTQRGVIEYDYDVDAYYFDVTVPGAVLMSAIGLGKAVGNADVHLDLYTSGGALLASNDFEGSLGSGLSVSVSPGRYYLLIRGTTEGDVSDTGYSRYGTRGSYTIAGRIPN